MNVAQRVGWKAIYELLNLDASEEPTDVLAILNVGSLNGLTAEQLINAVNPFGKITELAMPKFASFCFMKCMSIADARNIYEGLHNVQRLGSNNEICYLSYYSRLPPEEFYQPVLPDGVVMLRKFISDVEEHEILEAINLNLLFNINRDDPEFQSYGQQIVYGEKSDDQIMAHLQIIPYACNKFWPRLRDALTNTANALAWDEPDQLTLHINKPGKTGVLKDEHSRYEEHIVFLSLLDGCTIEFHTNSKKSDLLIPGRSIVIISNEARYGCYRTIPSNASQVISMPNGALKISEGNRILLRFQHFRKIPCECKWKHFCDTKISKRDEMIRELLEEKAIYTEKRVQNLYSKLAKLLNPDYLLLHSKVVKFLNTFKVNALVYDIGCGAGPYFDVNPNICMIGCDQSHAFVQMCRNKGFKAFQSDCLSLPIQSGSADGCICIGVIHHLATEQHRLKAINELVRILRKGGRCLIYVWCVHHSIGFDKSRGFQPDPFELKIQNEKDGRENFSDTGTRTIKIPLNEDSTIRKPEPDDIWWKTDEPVEFPNSMDYEDTDSFRNHSHIFSWEEIETLINSIRELSVLEVSNDNGNICVLFKRL